MIPGFHLREGFHFERVGDGDVRITYAPKGEIVAQITVPENEWASVVASVSANGETAGTWQSARGYHMGRCV